MPEGVVYVGRPTDFGNPFVVGDSLVPTSFRGELSDATLLDGAIYVTAENCLVFFEAWARQIAAHYPMWLERLRGKDLACWCRLTSPCHADILLRLANEAPPSP
jgi:hypothetical protein